MIITTTQSIEGQTIREYKGVVVGEAMMGANIVRDFFASIADVIGGRSGAYEQKLADEARARGANAVVGVDLDYELDKLADYARDELRNHLRAFEG